MAVQTQAAAEPITGKELGEMGDLGPCELVEGQIIKMSPTFWKHGDVEQRVAHYLNAFVREYDLGRVMSGEVGIYTQRDPDTVRGADVLFISHGRLQHAAPEDFLDVAPELVVEVISPSNRWQEMRKKLGEYFAIGVEHVWIVEPKNRAVQVYRSLDEVRTLTEGEVLQGSGVLEGFTIAVAELFA